MTLLIAAILLWKFDFIDFSYKPIESSLILAAVFALWLVHLVWIKLEL